MYHVQFSLFSASCMGIVHLLQLMSQYWYTIINWSQNFTLCSTTSFDKCIMPCIGPPLQYYWRISPPLRSPMLYLFLAPLFQAPNNHWSFIFIILPFPECQKAGILYNIIVFSLFRLPDLLRKMHLRFIHVISWLGNSVSCIVE